ncbi:Transposon Ty3-G Gag-Pol polyprotein [Labeo rohita]|uniref:Transposon Ty3-G Gag-Pol polyprotein n=1 Tax=Labeo rohita TaxID=84645 RepID=A0ABQ8LDF2_LABRO|nr:Transposon Ty3-G Gag-Pol polyprotein [Labeo rohita]
MVLQGTAVSSERIKQHPPGNVAVLGGSRPPRRSLEQPDQLFPAGHPLQGADVAVLVTPEVSLERLIPLLDHLAAWIRLPNVSQWVLHTVERGYRIQFGSPPPLFNRDLPTLVGPEQALVMEQEVNTLLRKETIEVVPPLEESPGTTAGTLLFQRKMGIGCVLDLCQLNRAVMRLRFSMLTLKHPDQVSLSCQISGCIPPHVHPSSTQEVPEVRFGGKAYQNWVLPSGLALSPRTFIKYVDAALAPLRLQGIHILNHRLLLMLAHSEQMVVQHRNVVLAHMKELGLRLKRQENCGFSTTEDHLPGRGVGFDHDAGTSVSCLDRVDPHLHQENQNRPVTRCQTFPETVGSDGSCVQRNTFWPAVHETPAVVAQDQGVLPKGKSASHDQGRYCW